MKFEITKKGYDISQVDAYIRMLSDQYTGAYEEHEKLIAQYEQLETRFRQLEAVSQKREREEALRYNKEQTKERTAPADAALIGQTLLDAQKIAAQTTKRAEEEARRIQRSAQEEVMYLLSVKEEILKLIVETKKTLDTFGGADENIGRTQPRVHEFLPLASGAIS